MKRQARGERYGQMLFALSALLTLLVAPAVHAQAHFPVASSTALTYPPPSGSSYVLRITPAAAVDQVAATVVGATGPGGHDLPSQALSVPPEPRSVEMGVAIFPLTVQPEPFARFGEYKAFVRLTAIGADGKPNLAMADTVTLTITHAAPVAETSLTADQSFRVYRTFPWDATALQKFSIDLREAGGRSALGPVSVISTPMLFAGKEVTGGTVSADPQSISIPAGQAKPVTLKLEGFDRAGTATGKLMFVSDGKVLLSIPVSIVVADAWYVPLAVIMLSVVAASALRWLRGNRQPADRNAYRIARLRNQAAMLAPGLLEPTNVAALQQVQNTLSEAVSENGLGNIQAAETQITKAGGDLGKLQEDMTRRHADYTNQCATISGELAAIKGTHTLGKVGDECIAQLQAQLAAIEQNLYVGLIDQAGRALAALNAALTNFKGQVQAASGLGARSVRTAGAGAGARGSRIAVTVPDQQRGAQANDELTFELLDGGGQPLPGNVVVTWSFGDGMPALSNSKGPSMKRRFTQPGVYGVTATVTQAGGASETVNTQVAVAPNIYYLLQEKYRHSLLRSEMAIMIVAVALAALTGLLELYVGRAFGSVQDYVTAILWGFGIDSAVRGFASVYSKLTPT